MAQYRKEFSLEEILAAEVISWAEPAAMCCPTGDGGGQLWGSPPAPSCRTLDPPEVQRAR